MNDFIEELRDVCKQQSQRVVAEKMGYSHTTISLVLNGKYAGNLKTVEKAFNGAFKSAAVICPILGGNSRASLFINPASAVRGDKSSARFAVQGLQSVHPQNRTGQYRPASRFGR